MAAAALSFRAVVPWWATPLIRALQVVVFAAAWLPRRWRDACIYRLADWCTVLIGRHIRVEARP